MTKTGKPCRDCGEVLTPQGGRCPECQREWRRDYNRKLSASGYWKDFYAANRERRKRESREYAEPRMTEIASRARQWRRDNTKRENATKRAYRAAHPEKIRDWRTRANWRRRGENAPDALALAYSEVLRSDPCAYCGEESREIDHVDPLSGEGANEWSNLTASCRFCNRSKGTKPLLPFLLERTS